MNFNLKKNLSVFSETTFIVLVYLRILFYITLILSNRRFEFDIKIRYKRTGSLIINLQIEAHGELRGGRTGAHVFACSRLGEKTACKSSRRVDLK